MPIKVLLVEDSPIATVILKRIIESAPDLSLVGTARTGVDALRLIPKVQPDIICTDLHMPQMNGLELTKEVMDKYPRPILVISASVQEKDDMHNIFKLLEAGALDVFPKPKAGHPEDYELIKQPLLTRIRVLSGIKVFRKPRRDTPSDIPSRGFLGKSKIESKPPKVEPSKTTRTYSSFLTSTKIIAIGASTGGPQALQEILTNLPSDFPVPIICIQHISQGFLKGLVDWLRVECTLPIEIATQGNTPQPGVIYFPTEGRHLEIDNNGRFVCSDTPPIGGHRPSISVTFKSIARYYGRTAVGVLLTGMGKDGADGLLTMAQGGAYTIAQNEYSSVVFGMPKEAILLGAAKEILSIEQIAPALIKKVSGN